MSNRFLGSRPDASGMITWARFLSKELISAEYNTGSPTDSRGRAAVRVCEKLRPVLTTITGPVGFASLLTRALALAEAESGWLREVQVQSNGSLEHSPKALAELDSAVAATAGAELVTQLLGLLEVFIGDGLTHRLVSDVWPNAAKPTTQARKSLQ